MRFRGGGVGHVVSRYLDSRLKETNHDANDEQQDDTTLADLHEDGSIPDEEWGDDSEVGSAIHKEHTSQREPSNEGPDEEDERSRDRR